MKKYTSKRAPIVFEINSERFEAVKVPGWLFVEFTRSSESADEGTLAGMVYDVFQAAMDEAEFERFRKFCSGPEGPDIELLMAIMQDISAASAARPTKPPTRSQRGRGSIRAMSRDGSSSQEQTPNHSTSTGS